MALRVGQPTQLLPDVESATIDRQGPRGIFLITRLENSFICVPVAGTVASPDSTGGRIKQCCCCCGMLVDQRPSNMLVYPRDDPAQTILRAGHIETESFRSNFQHYHEGIFLIARF